MHGGGTQGDCLTIYLFFILVENFEVFYTHRQLEDEKEKVQIKLLLSAQICTT